MKKITLSLLVMVFCHTSYSQILTENFNNITTLPGAGWDQINVSTTVGTTDWFQGNDTVFLAYAGADDAYIGANFNNTTGASTISNWLITPIITVKNGDQIKFYTRTTTGSTFPDRLQVRLSDTGGSSTAPTNDTDVGSYTNLLLDINPTLAVGGYPDDWTEQVIDISGLTGATAVRIAFRYFVTNGGPSGSNSDYIGIDEVEVSSPPLSVNDIRLSDVTHFYNKSQSSLNLESKNHSFRAIKIYNLTGQEVISEKLSGLTERINLNDIAQGIYIVKIEVEDGTKLIKLVNE